jgi:Ca2+-transporting ATPase
MTAVSRVGRDGAGTEPTTGLVTVDRPPRGLSSAQAELRLAADGPNTVARPAPPKLYRRIAVQLGDPLVLLLLASGAVTALLGDIPDTAVIALVIAVNTTIGVVQEIRADRAIAALDHLSAPSARVFRDGIEQQIPAADVVVGDEVAVHAGDIVPADLTVHRAELLRLDEAALTGESVPITRSVGAELSAGTVVVAGRGRGTVIRTGGASTLGRISALVAEATPVPTPLQRRLGRLSRQIGLAVVVLSGVVFVVGLTNGRGVVAMAITAVSLVVAAVPESLPAVVTIALALGARRMAAKRAVPRRLHAVETLGSVTVLASDKTGTLTEGRMSVRRAWLPDGSRYTAHGVGYEPTGVIADGDGEAVQLAPALQELALGGALCNDAILLRSDGVWTVVGDPLEGALLAFAARCGLDLDQAKERRRLDERPFDEAARHMLTSHEHTDGALVVCKGAPEVVIDMTDAGPAQRDAVAAVVEDWAAAGLRVIAIATAIRPDRDTLTEAPSGLALLGLVGVGDPIRPAAKDTVSQLRAAGVALLLVTGDHPATAAAIAAEVGIGRPDSPVVRGDEPGFEVRPGAEIFARTRPEQKLTLIRALQEAGEVVAMTGDGVNDAPALRRADIGVAMGGGTEVARQAADLVLADDNLGTVLVAVREGRRIQANIRRFLWYALAGGVAEIVVMLFGPFLGLAIPLLPAQILWINLLTHGLPGVALGAEPAEAAAMRSRPTHPDESVLGNGLGRAIAATGAAISAAALTVGVVAAHLGWPWQSMVYVTLGFAQLGVAVAVRARRETGQSTNNGLWLALLISGLLQIGGVLVAPLRELLSTESLSAGQLLVCGAASAAPGLIVMARKMWLRRAVETGQPALTTARPNGDAETVADRADDLESGGVRPN